MSYDWTTEYLSAGVDQNVYAIYRSQSTGKVWDGADMVTWDDADIADYDVPSVFAGGDLYGHAIPADLPAGDTYLGRAYVRAGVAPATDDNRVGEEFPFAWDGSAASDAPGPGTPAGTYADVGDLWDWYGVKNINAYSDLENGSTDAPDNDRIQKWLDKADAWIDLAFTRAGRTVPITSDESDFSALTDVAAEWAGAMLAKGRGDLSSGFSKPDGFDDSMDGHIERAQARLNELVSGWQDTNEDSTVTQPGVFTFVPLVRSTASAGDENSE